jgi:hypothetical protein
VTAETAMLVDARLAHGGLPRDRELSVNPGEEAVLLLTGDTAIEQGGASDDRVLLRIGDFSAHSFLRTVEP